MAKKSDISDIVLATGNPGKVEELHMLLADTGFRLHALNEWPNCPAVEEDQPTLAGNAQKKARIVFGHTGLATLADDTGLEVDFLDGKPGVHSARFAGSESSDAMNRLKLLEALGSTEDRSARFRTVAAFQTDMGIRLFEGVCEGRIGFVEKGDGGFGYDSLFLPSGYDSTFAELDQQMKNTLSHRGEALRKFVAFLSAHHTESS